MIAVTGLLNACTIAQPLVLPQLPESEEAQKVFVAIADAVYQKNFSSRFRFWRQTFSVVDVLNEQPGFLALSTRIELLGNRATTMTAWKDRASMMRFAYGDGLHKDIVSNDTTLIDAVFYAAVFDADDLPSWQQALKLLDTEGRHFYE